MATPQKQPPQQNRTDDLRRTVISCIMQKLNRLDIKGLSAVLATAQKEIEARKNGR